MKEPFPKIIPPHGNYPQLLCYQKAEIAYDITWMFCGRFLRRGDRTIDQMIQAARSGKQNIAEGSKASGTSKEMEIKLMNVARASLEELKLDYLDFLRVRNFSLWPGDSREALYVRRLGRGEDKGFSIYRPFCETRPAEVVANVAICVIFQANFLLDRLIRKLERDFTNHGGLRERMSFVRRTCRFNGRAFDGPKGKDFKQP